MSQQQPDGDESRPWELRDKRIQERYDLVSEALETELEEIGIPIDVDHFDGIGYVDTFDPDSLTDTVFEPVLTETLTTDHQSDSPAVTAGYNAVRWDDDEVRLRLAEGPDTSNDAVYFGTNFDDVDTSVYALTKYDTAEEVAGQIASSLQKQYQNAIQGVEQDGLQYHERKRFWPSAFDADRSELRNHILDRVSKDGSLKTDRELTEYIREVRRWYPSSYPDRVDDKLLEPKEDYLDRRLDDAAISPLSVELVVELLQDDDEIAYVGQKLSNVVVEIKEHNIERGQLILSDLDRYGYRQSNIEKPEHENSWVRITYRSHRDHREILGRLLKAGVDADTALTYWGSKVFNARRSGSSSDKSGWMDASGVDPFFSREARQEVRGYVPGVSYLPEQRERPAPEPLRKESQET